ncbi:NAD(P)H-dependent flavin oxidoreductase [Neoroseomonas oryzicola]|uniref:Nitronate monooxygenase n=1 Tax=Neoroseomonas oryzicola TaxID=535904 RepID=A0A9X9WBE4_9PROT|nr:nitronate monooxygenase family protein [Neoroseomonas oryzicola]MBR0657654.1 nitronate monooxygenase [Neoroseomonas oryzicola]NKE18910.1 nitronate monooxygenase [Neoroseomonas oryzicola]
MPIPAIFEGRLSVPVVASPQFLVSGPDYVVEACRAGVVGTFPALNQRTTEGYDAWLAQIGERLAAIPRAAPFGINLIVHKSNARLKDDLAATVRHKVPLVITSLGIVPEVIAAVQSYGGLVFHDVTNMRHAVKAIEGGVDGLIAVCAGAGGHAGRLSPFALLPELRAIYAGPLLMGGAISTGRHIAAALMLGADMAYMGTRFIAVRESMAVQAHKDMVVQAKAADIVYTPAISGVHANFLRASIAAAGLDPDNLPEAAGTHVGDHDKRPWKNIWSAGQGVGAIEDVPSIAELVARLGAEYRAALREAAAAA